jgi:endonuclease YncB( thermonuclease family)
MISFVKTFLIALIAILIIPVISRANTLVIKTVHSGDLIEFEGGFIVRLTGIKVPDKSTELGYKFYKFTKSELEGKIVKVFTYTTNNMASGIVYDEEGYPFAMIIYGKSMNSNDWSKNFNELLLKKGYAKVDEEYLPDELKYFKDIERKARRKKIGIWKNESEDKR